MIDERESVVLINEGQKIFSVLHKPKNCKKYPVVLICHGLAGQKVGRYRVYVELSEALCAFGIASLRFDFRGSGDSEGIFKEMTLKGEVSDACMALKYLQNHPEIDNSKIALFGRSMGGAVAILAACQFKNIKSICLWAPVFHGQDWLGHWNKAKAFQLDSAEFKNLLTIEGQVPGRQFFEEFFSMQIQKELEILKSVPMFFIHGLIDPLVPIDHTRKYLHYRQGVPSETKFIELPLGDHHFSNISEREFAIQETCQWFKKTLL